MAKYVAVRYGAMDAVDLFEAQQDGLREGDEVIVRTDRGVEWGQVVGPADAGDKRIVEASGPRGAVLRKATEQDILKNKEIHETQEAEEFKVCHELITRYNLPMKLVRAEHLFGGNKLIFYFLADGRVDFRQLVKDLAKRYRTRIEMRQIGVRDEARMLGGFGPCGRELCCRTFLKALKPIPMKIAKSQKSTLDPAKISGRCGRLKCCLNFEDGLYAELKQKLPRRGNKVSTPLGEGIVVGYDIMGQTVDVRFDDNTQQTLPVKDVEVIARKTGEEGKGNEGEG
jgi:cell fate regulator YaaT (PSP1 superfamily)